MKNRLGRIKTTYDEDARYDTNLYFKQQQQIYKRQIQFASKVDAITEQRFALKPLQIGFMQSSALQNQPKFKQIKNILTQYNIQVLQNKCRQVKGLHFKRQVMDSCLIFMRVMMLAPDTATKKNILDVSYHWLIHHLDPKTKRLKTDDLKKEIKKILIQRQLAPIDIVNKALLHNMVKQQTYHYRIKARTKYPELDAPKIQLQNYHTHKLEFVSDKNDIRGGQPNKNWIDTVKFPKIEPSPYFVQEEEPEKSVPGNFDLPPNQPQKPTQQQQSKDVQGTVPTEQAKPGQENAAPQNQQQDLGFGEPAEPDQAQPQEFQQPENQKKRGKLDPLLKGFLLQRIRAKQKQEISCDRKYEKKYNITNKTHFQQMDDIGYMSEWAKQRSRLKTEFARKNQSMRGFNKVNRGKNNQSSSLYNKFLENDLDNIKVNKTLHSYQKNISKVQTPAQKLNAERGMSLYDRRRVKTEFDHKPFSSILQDNTQRVQREKALDEIGSIKQKFAKTNIYTPLDQLIKGLSNPLEKDPEYEPVNGKVAWPNSQLLSNPFFKISKKKKKKKKKK